jgi:hypothetical protein
VPTIASGCCTTRRDTPSRAATSSSPRNCSSRTSRGVPGRSGE